jgi:hypothetical protein
MAGTNAPSRLNSRRSVSGAQLPKRTSKFSSVPLQKRAQERVLWSDNQADHKKKSRTAQSFRAGDAPL